MEPSQKERRWFLKSLQRKQSIGGSVVFHCPSETCGAVIHRDINAARNIYIKYYDSSRVC